MISLALLTERWRKQIWLPIVGAGIPVGIYDYFLIFTCILQYTWINCNSPQFSGQSVG